MKRSNLFFEEVKLFLFLVVCISAVLFFVQFISQEVADAYLDAQEVTQETSQEVTVNDRFLWVDGSKCNADIIVDSETGVCYLWKGVGYRGGLTVLVDSAGNPVIWEE